MPDPNDSLARKVFLAEAAAVRQHLAEQEPATPPQTHAERRDRYAQVIYERWNPGSRWADAHPDDVIAYGADADAAIAAADSAAGIPFASPTHTDIYHQVADRLAALATKSTCRWATPAAAKVRDWADQDAQPAEAPETALSPAEEQAAGLASVLAEVRAERTRQEERWGEQNHPDGTGPTLEILPGWPARDLADTARSACQLHADMGIVTWRDILGEETTEALSENDPTALRAELLQVAAVAVAWIEAIDRRSTQGGSHG